MKKERAESTLAETPSHQMQQIMSSARAPDKMEPFIHNKLQIAAQLQSIFSDMTLSLYLRGKEARSFHDRPPGVGNSYCDTLGKGHTRRIKSP